MNDPKEPEASFQGQWVYTQVPDGGWNWAVGFSFSFTEVFNYSTIKSFGVFFNNLMNNFV